MRPLADLTRADVEPLVGLVFDLDDTLLDHGELGLEAYASLFALREAGLRLVACTGRPAGWADVFARTWPIDAAIAENGAVAFRKTAPGRVALWDPAPPDRRARRREALAELTRALRDAFPALELADDAAARLTDVAFDVGERRVVPADVVAAARASAHAAGARTFVSSVHLHVTFDTADKASGAVHLSAAALGLDPSEALARLAFVGDSENDAPAFAAFRTTFGVANVRPRARAMTRPPRFVAPSPRGRGFAEIVAAILDRRAPCAPPARG